MHTQIRWCSECQDDQVFEVAQCGDSPEQGGCPELCCALCGLGVFDSALMAIVEDAEQSTPAAGTAVA